MREYNSLADDIRLSKISKTDALDVIRSFVNAKSWVYIKSCEQKMNVGSSEDYVVNYNKFKTNSIDVDISTGYLYIYGAEDRDRLIISTNDLVQTEISSEKDEILLTLEFLNVKLKIVKQ